MEYEFSQKQIAETKKYIRRKIFYLILYVDRDTSMDYKGVDVGETFRNVLSLIFGFNDLLGQSPEIVTAMSYLVSACNLYNSEHFSYKRYRKLILDAGSEIAKVKEV